MKLRFSVGDNVMHDKHGLCKIYACRILKHMGSNIDVTKILGNKDYVIGKEPLIKEDEHLFSVFDNELSPA